MNVFSMSSKFPKHKNMLKCRMPFYDFKYFEMTKHFSLIRKMNSVNKAVE